MSGFSSLWERRPDWPLVTRRTLQRSSMDAFEMGKQRRVLITNAEMLAAVADLEKEHLILMTNVRTLRSALTQRERNAFDIGVDAGAAGLVRPSDALLAERDELREAWPS